MINKDKNFCYRIIHRDNLRHCLAHGLLCKNHENSSRSFVTIGNKEIIDVRSTTSVYLKGFGTIGEYVPFYFTAKSIMLYNIVTGYRAPVVPKRQREEIVVIRCLIHNLSTLDRWFFTNGQANDSETYHYSDLKYLSEIDWNCIQNSDFSKSDGDYDRPRRYQAEFLVQNSVPVDYIESICVFNDNMKEWAENEIKELDLAIPVYIQPPYFF